MASPLLLLLIMCALVTARTPDGYVPIGISLDPGDRAVQPELSDFTVTLCKIPHPRSNATGGVVMFSDIVRLHCSETAEHIKVKASEMSLFVSCEHGEHCHADACEQIA